MKNRSGQTKLVIEFGKYFIETYFGDTLLKMTSELNKNQPG